MVHQLPAGGVAAGRDRMTAVKGTRVEISAGKYYPTLDGRQARAAREAGLSITGVWGEAFALISKCLEIKKRVNIIKTLDKPLYTGLFEVFV